MFTEGRDEGIKKGKKTDWEDISGQASTAISQPGECGRCRQEHRRALMWRRHSSIHWLPQQTLFWFTYYVHPAVLTAWSSAVSQPGPHDSTVRLPFTAEDRFSCTNYVNTICPVVGFQNDSLQMPVSARNQNRQKVSKNNPPACQILKKFWATWGKMVAVDRMCLTYNVSIEAMNTNYSIRPIYLLWFMTSFVKKKRHINKSLAALPHATYFYAFGNSQPLNESPRAKFSTLTLSSTY